MAYSRMYIGKEVRGWGCYSGDTKPTTPDEGIATGDLLQEINTGKKFIWFNGAWEEDLSLIYAFSEALKQ